MKVLHLTPFWGANSGGQGTVANHLSHAQRALGVDAIVWTVEQDLSSPSSGWVLGPQDSWRAFSNFGPTRLAFSPDLNKALQREGEAFDVLHLHGLWTALSASTRVWRRAYQRPTVVAPHGLLQADALRRSPIRKAVVKLLYENLNLREATVIHACSEAERESVRQAGLRNPIATIPNGVSREWLESEDDAARAREALSVPADQRVGLFMSRIHPTKGLPMLFHALAQRSAELRDWLFVIAGMQELNHQHELEELANELQIKQMVKFVGPLHGQLKRDAFAIAEMFVLPTLTENFGIVIAEALGAGVPVITTHRAPWSLLQRHDCGWWVEPKAAAIGCALLEAASLAPHELAQMGRRGRALVADRFTWERVARQTVELYEWTMGGGPMPAFVEPAVS